MVLRVIRASDAAAIFVRCMSQSATRARENETAAAIRRAGLAFFGIMLVLPVSAETLLFQPDGGSYGSANGSSWANAFNGFSGVSWGSGTGKVGPGDTHMSALEPIPRPLLPGVSGTSGSPINILAAQDTYTGVAHFSTISMNSLSYITMNGGYNGATNFDFAAA